MEADTICDYGMAANMIGRTVFQKGGAEYKLCRQSYALTLDDYVKVWFVIEDS